MEDLEKSIILHLKSHDLYQENFPWKIEKSHLGGRGLFAARNIKSGEIVFVDFPFILGPRAAFYQTIGCAVCFLTKPSKPEEFRGCSKGCGVHICSEQCEDTTKHRVECDLIRKWNHGKSFPGFEVGVHKSLTPIRSLFLSENEEKLLKMLKAHGGGQHGFEVDFLVNKLGLNISEKEAEFMKHTCYVMDANSYEVVVNNEASVKGLYPLSSLMNHNCTPNTMHLFDKNQKMILKASRDIGKGEEINHSYARLLWGNVARRPHLARTKHFFCCCKRCEDPSEFGTNLSALLCKKCKNNILPAITKSNITWKCNNCQDEIPSATAGTIISVLASRLQSFKPQDIEDALKFLNGTLLKYAPSTSQIALDLKYKLLFSIGYQPGYSWKELNEELLKEKEEICLELLRILRQLELGQCKMKGHILYELYKCYSEKCRRLQKSGQKENGYKKEEILKEITEILDGDVLAPMIIYKNKLPDN